MYSYILFRLITSVFISFSSSFSFPFTSSKENKYDHPFSCWRDSLKRKTSFVVKLKKKRGRKENQKQKEKSCSEIWRWEKRRSNSVQSINQRIEHKNLTAKETQKDPPVFHKLVSVSMRVGSVVELARPILCNHPAHWLASIHLLLLDAWHLTHQNKSWGFINSRAGKFQNTVDGPTHYASTVINHRRRRHWETDEGFFSPSLS